MHVFNLEKNHISFNNYSSAVGGSHPHPASNHMSQPYHHLSFQISSMFWIKSFKKPKFTTRLLISLKKINCMYFWKKNSKKYIYKKNSSNYRFIWSTNIFSFWQTLISVIDIDICLVVP